MSTQPQPGGTPQDELLALADALLEEAAEMRRQWGELHRVLRGETAPERPAGARDADTDPRRLLAVELMLGGSSRADIEQRLRREFGDVAAEEVLADVYGD